MEPSPTRPHQPPIDRRAVWHGLFWSLLAAVAAGIVVWKTGLEDRFVAKRFGVVVPGEVYRSGQISRWMIEDVLTRHKIEAIILLNGTDPYDEHQRAEFATAERLGVPVHQYPLRGNGTGDVRRYADALAMIHKCRRQGKPVLVHCHAGVKRAGAAVGFYRLLVQNWPPERVLLEMKRYDCDVQNVPKVVTYMNDQMPRLADLLVDRGVIAEPPATMPRLDP